VLGVNRQVWHLPQSAGGGILSHHTFVDRVLVRAGEGGKDQIACVWLPHWHFHARAALADGPDRVDIAEIQTWINALRVHIEGYSHNIHVSGTLAIAKKRPLDTLRASEQAQFCSGNTRAPVVMRVDTDNGRLAVAQVTTEPFDLIGIDVCSSCLNGIREVEDNLVFE